MPRSKRPYVPKRKGCYECSQRRIHCDNSRPLCHKCKLRGIQCSGYGVRYRFRGTAQDGKKIRSSCESDYDQNPTASQEDSDTIRGIDSCSPSANSQVCDSDTRARPCNTRCETALTKLRDQHLEGLPSGEATTPKNPTLGPLVPWKQYLLNYFSRKIAGEMVAIDDRRNGWRYLVLPIAQEDELVNDAVLSAAAFHFSVNVNAQFLDPGAVYQSAIRKLRLRQDMTCYNVVEQQKILLSLLVLLVAAVVSGSSDFRTIFGLLEGALYALGGEDRISHGELGRFVVWQIRKYRGWVSPHLSLEHGVKRLHQSVTKPYKSDGWEDISQGCLLYPKFESSWSLIYKLNEQACNIYVMRALAEPGTPPYTDLVDRFINTLELLPPDSPGMYLVPFTIFLAAAESSEVTQHELFENVLLEHSKRTGFANLPLALRFLREIWSGSRYLAWTEAFTKLPVFVV